MQWLRMIPSEDARKTHEGVLLYFQSVGEPIELSESSEDEDEEDEDDDDDEDEDEMMGQEGHVESEDELQNHEWRKLCIGCILDVVYANFVE